MSSWFPATTTAALLSTPLVVIIFIVGHMAVTAPSVPCPTGCDCSEDKLRLLTAKCSLNTFAVDPAEDFFSIQLLSFNNSDTMMPISLKDDMFQAFSGVTNIELSNCSVGYIHPGAFKGLKFLQDLDLSSNHITHFHRTSFLSTPKLSYLNLNNNPIEITDLFLSSRSLEELELESCSIQHIPAGAFKGLSKLKRLSLYNNSLETIPAHTLPRGLKRLNVARNQLVNVPTEVIYNLNRVRSLDLSENLINCSCKLMGLQDWLSGRGVTFENDVLCASPSKYNGKSWNTVNEDEICDKEIRMSKDFNNHVFGESMSVDSECDDMKASCDELSEVLQADQPLAKQESEKTSENELTPNDEPVETENYEGAAPATDMPEGKKTSEGEEDSQKETESGSEEKLAEDVVKSDQETSQDTEGADVDDATDKTEEETADKEATNTNDTKEKAESVKDKAGEETNTNGSAEVGEESPKEESADQIVGEGLNSSDGKASEDSTPSTGDKEKEADTADASETLASDNEYTPTESTSISGEKVENVEESATDVSSRAAEGRSLSISATDSPSNEETGQSTNLPEVKASVASSVVPVEADYVESTTVEKVEAVENINPSSSTTESSVSSETVPELGQSPETSSVEPSATVENIPETGDETTVSSIWLSSSENPSSSAAPEETTLPALDVSSVSSSIAAETTSSFPELSSSVSPENIDVITTTPETNVDATALYTSSSETPTSSEIPVSSSTTESTLSNDLDVSSSTLPSSSSTLDSVVSAGVEVSTETPLSSTPVVLASDLDENSSNLTEAVAPNLEEPMINYSKVINELKENPGAYVLGGIVFLLAVLLLIALSRCRKAPATKRREPKYDSDMNGGTELQEITSLIPNGTNGTKIFNNKYPNEKPSKDMMNLLSTVEKEGNGVVIPLHGDTNGTASNNNTPWANGTKVNGKNCNGTSGKPGSPGSMASMVDRGSQFFDDGVNPPIELTKVKVMMLPDSVPKTPVFVHRKYGDENS